MSYIDQRIASHRAASTSLPAPFGVLRPHCIRARTLDNFTSQAHQLPPHHLKKAQGCRLPQCCSASVHHVLDNGACTSAKAGSVPAHRGSEGDFVKARDGSRIPLMAEEYADTDLSTNQELISHSHSIAEFFTADDWEYHQTSRRYFRNLINIGTSTVFRRILAPCLMVASFAALVAFYNYFAPLLHYPLPVLAIAYVPHTLLGSALSLLLVFRTNSSYGRLVEGRRMWGQVVRSAREWARMTTVYFPDALHPEALSLIQAFAIVLKGKVRPGRTRRDPADGSRCAYDTRAKLGAVLGPDAAAYVLSTRNPPGTVARALSRCLNKAAQAQEEECIPLFAAQRCEEIIRDLVTAASGCDRLFQTPIPVSYTRHTARSLMLWLMTLPMALWPVMGTSMVPTCFFCAYVLIGIDELGVQIEEPSAILPLVPLLNKIRYEVQASVAELHRSINFAV